MCLFKTNKALRNEVEALKRQVAEKDKQLADLKEAAETDRKEITALRNICNDQSKRLDKMKKQLQRQTERNNTQQMIIDKQREALGIEAKPRPDRKPREPRKPYVAPKATAEKPADWERDEHNPYPEE